MGNSNWSHDAYQNLRKDYSTKSTAQIFPSTDMNPDMNPKGVQFRESRDSDANPESVGVCVFLDVTGSMGKIPDTLIREKLGVLMQTIIDHGTKHPHVLFGAIGDHYTDGSPLQVGQFEAGTDELNKWLTSTFIEEGGGGQQMESYSLAWLFAARHTSIDCYEKRGQKGFLFTIGDESYHPKLESAALREILGYTGAEDISSKQILKEAQKQYHVFHIHVNHGGLYDSIINEWRDLLNERLIILDDYTATAEVIASTIAVIHGADLAKVTKTFDSKTAGVVSNALVKINSSVQKHKADDGVIKL